MTPPFEKLGEVVVVKEIFSPITTWSSLFITPEKGTPGSNGLSVLQMFQYHNGKWCHVKNKLPLEMGKVDWIKDQP